MAEGLGCVRGLQLAGPHGWLFDTSRGLWETMKGGGRQRAHLGVYTSWTLAPRALSASRGLGYDDLGSGRGYKGRPASCTESRPGRFSVTSLSPQPSPNPA